MTEIRVKILSIGERILDLRKAQNLSQGQLAEAMEVSRQAVSKWETGQNVPDALNLIRLAEILDTDIEYLSTGRRNYGRRPPVVIKTTETVEKIVEKPVVKVVEKPVERVIEKIVEVEKPVIQYVDRPVSTKKVRVKYVRNPAEFVILGVICFIIGLLLGIKVA